MVKISRRITIVLLSLTLAICGWVVGVAPITFSVRAETTYTKPFETTNVLDDLKGSSIDGVKFNLSDYPKDNSKETRLISFLEYCYSNDKINPQDYSLYVYVYNPKAIKFSESSMLNQIEMSFGSDTDNYKKFPLRVVNYSLEEGYERVFYKFKVVLTSEEKQTIMKKLDKDKRIYNVSGIELLEDGKLNAADYTVARKYTYTGFAPSYSSDNGASGNLTYSSAEIEVLQLEVFPTQYRPDGYNGKNIYTQDSLHSVYFAVPKSVITEYGNMTKVHATWLNAVLKPSLVIGDKSVYNAIKPYIGVDIGTKNTTVKHIYLGDLDVIGDSNANMQYYCGYAYNLNRNDFGSSNLKYGEQITELDLLLCTPNGEDPDDYVIPSRFVIDEMINATGILGGELVNGKYSKALFESVDSKFTEVEISAEDKFDLTSTVIDMDFWKWLFGQNLEVTTKFNGIKAIYPISESDLSGTAEEISKRLYIGKQDVTHLKQLYENTERDYVVYLFRYQVSDYVSQRAKHCYWDRQFFKDVFKSGTADGYFFKETVNLDFDIIDVTFTKGFKDTVIPVVSNPIDVVPSPTPPPDIFVPVPDSHWYDGLLNVLKWVGLLFVIYVIYGIVRLFKPKKKKEEDYKNEDST